MPRALESALALDGDFLATQFKNAALVERWMRFGSGTPLADPQEPLRLLDALRGPERARYDTSARLADLLKLRAYPSPQLFEDASLGPKVLFPAEMRLLGLGSVEIADVLGELAPEAQFKTAFAWQRARKSAQGRINTRISRAFANMPEERITRERAKLVSVDQVRIVLFSAHVRYGSTVSLAIRGSADTPSTFG